MKRSASVVTLRVTFIAALALLGACGDRAPADGLPTVVALSPDSARHSNHAFSPDGARVAYFAPTRESTGMWQLWVANADLTAPTRLPVTTSVLSAMFWAPDGTRLAVVSGQFGVADVVVVTVATGEVQRVTRGPGVEVPLGWRRGDERLAYYGTSADGSIKAGVVLLATGEVLPLVPDESKPYLGAPSPDGTRVAYFAVDGSKFTIWMADSLGGNRRQLTTEGFETLEQFNEWSPDGSSLLYQSSRTGTSDLWIFPLDSGAPRQLTRNVRNEYFGAWSPDGKWIAFVSNRGKQTDLWIVSSAGGEEHRVTNTADAERRPRWRGADALSFEVRAERNGVWALDLADGTERRLTPDSLRIIEFMVSPDGSQTSFLIDRGGGSRELAVAPVAGGAMRVLVSETDGIADPRWSPDGTKLAYSSFRAGTADIWVVDVAGGAPRQLMNWPSYESCPSWSQNGSEILFSSDRETRLSDLWKVTVTGGEPTRLTRSGSLQCARGRSGEAQLFGTEFSARGGQLGVVRVQPNGVVQTVWNRSNALLGAIFPRGDSIAAEVEQPDGSLRSMILSSSGRGGRVILGKGEAVSNVSFDGTLLLFQTTVGGSTELSLLNLADGTTRRLTNSR